MYQINRLQRQHLLTLPTWLQVFVPPHPLVKNWLAVARHTATAPQLFRSACAELGRILITPGVWEFPPTTQVLENTPMALSDVEVVHSGAPCRWVTAVA
jgi:uracil phosphoribosyltransferase